MVFIKTSGAQAQMTQQSTNQDQVISMQQMATVNSQQILKDPIITQQETLNNLNALKHIELPKISPNQQLFSLNTITNQITQLSPGLTTASLGPMERLLIVPAGVNKQQLSKCLIQGQIHFDNIGMCQTIIFMFLLFKQTQ